MNENDRQRIKAMFPHASAEFLDLNLGFGVRPEKPKPSARPALVDQAPGKTEGDARISVSIVMYRVRALDRDNAYASVKPLVDSLQSCGLIFDDSEEHINLTVTQEKVAHRNEQRTTLEITYPK